MTTRYTQVIRFFSGAVERKGVSLLLPRSLGTLKQAVSFLPSNLSFASQGYSECLADKCRSSGTSFPRVLTRDSLKQELRLSDLAILEFGKEQTFQSHRRKPRSF